MDPKKIVDVSAKRQDDGAKERSADADCFRALILALKSLKEDEFFHLARGANDESRQRAPCADICAKYKKLNPEDTRSEKKIRTWIYNEMTRLRGINHPPIPKAIQAANDHKLLTEWKKLIEEVTGIYAASRDTTKTEDRDRTTQKTEEKKDGPYPREQLQNDVEATISGESPVSDDKQLTHGTRTVEYEEILRSQFTKGLDLVCRLQENDGGEELDGDKEASGRKKAVTVITTANGCSDAPFPDPDQNDEQKTHKVYSNMKFTSKCMTCGLEALHPSAESPVHENEIQLEAEENEGAAKTKENDLQKTLSVDEADDLMHFEPRGMKKEGCDRNLETIGQAVMPTKDDRNLQKVAPSGDFSCIHHKAAGDSLRMKDIFCEAASGEQDAYGEKEANMHTAANGCTGAPCPDPHPNDDQNADKVYSNMKFSSLSMTCGLAALHPPGENLIFENEIQFQPEEESGDAERMEENDVDKTLSRNVEELEEKKESRDGDRKLENPGLALILNKVDRHLQEENSLRLAPSGENSMENGCGCVGDLAALRVENNEIRHELEIHRERVKEMEERVSSLEAMLIKLLAKKRDPSV